MKGLIIKSPWIDLILEGKKTWEIRGSNAKTRGKIALIKSGTGMMYGTVEMVDSHLLSASEYQQAQQYHAIPKEQCQEMPYTRIHAWVLKNPVTFDKPIPYTHPQGAVIWVNLGDIHQE